MEHGVRETLALDWYEAGLAPSERKQRGHFSTPHALVDQILDVCGYTTGADLRALRVLDPACGSGNFLARAAGRLCQSLASRNPDRKALVAQVQRNLWGLDPDPVACFLAEMQVSAVLEAACGTRRNLPVLHIHQADSLALNWQPCVDLLVANPPYLATKNTDLSQYFQANPRGQADSYLLFLELALRAVRPGGWIGLVLPDPVLARANAATARATLLRECTIQHLWHLSGVFAAEVGAVVIVAQKIPPRSLHRIGWIRTRWQGELDCSANEGEHRPVSQTLLAAQPGSELRYLFSYEQGRVVERLQRMLHTASRSAAPSRLLPLESLVDIKRGEEIGRNSTLLQPFADLKDGLPVLRGGVDLAPYALSTGDLGIERAVLKKPVERYLQPKLLVVKSTERLQAALDTRGHVVLQTLYLLQLRGGKSTHSMGEAAEESRDRGVEESLARVGFEPAQDEQIRAIRAEEDDNTLYHYLLACLNTRLLRAYVYYLHTAYKLVQPQIEQTVLARLPIPYGTSSERREIAERASVLVRACSESGSVVEWDQRVHTLYEEQERAVRALYAAATPGIFVDKGVVSDG